MVKHMIMWQLKDELTEEEKTKLLAQIEELDFSVLEYCKNNPANRKGIISPLAAMQLEDIEKKWQQE